VSVFGEDAEVLNFDRESFVLGKMLTFNGNHNEIVRAGAKGDFDAPPRRCPGYSNAMNIIEFLVDRYCPNVSKNAVSVAPERLDEIQRKETLFMKFVLKMGQMTYAENNKYFPHASEVKHPLETNGRKIGSLKIPAAGDRHIPVYGMYRDVSAATTTSSIHQSISNHALLFYRRGCPGSRLDQGSIYIQSPFHGSHHR
jgi:hypothetical protein